MGKSNQENKLINLLYTFEPVMSVIFILMIWWTAASTHPELVPPPQSVVERFIMLILRPVSQTSILGHILFSLRRVLIAILFASIFGIPFGLFIGLNKYFRDVFNPLFEILRPIPPIAWIPLVTLWFGIGETSKIVIVFIGSLVAIVINTYTGVKMVDPFVIDVGKVFGAEGKSLLVEIIIPSALPAILAGIRTSVSAGWMSLLAAEMISSRQGLGFLITRGMDSNDTALIVVGMILVGTVGALISYFLMLCERWLCPWEDHQ